MLDVALKVVATPALIGAASLAGRRWGHHVGGWLVALPLTSGPVAFALAAEQGRAFAAQAAVGMLAATASQVAFAAAYARSAGRGPLSALVGGVLAFAAASAALSVLHWPALATFALVVVVLLGAGLLSRNSTRRPSTSDAAQLEPATTTRRLAPRWDIPLRMVVATAVVLLITAAAPVIGAHLAGLLSPFPVFGAVMALATHRSFGAAGAVAVLDGLVAGLAAPAVFFLVVALALVPLGVAAFALAAAAAVLTQATTAFVMPRSKERTSEDVCR